MLRNGAYGGITGGGGGRREGAFARPLLPGEGKRYGRGRGEPLLERPAAGVRGRAPDHYSRGSGGVKEGARKGVTGGGMPPGASRRRDERCRDRRGERRSHGRGQEQALPAGRTPALPEGAQALPEETSTGVRVGFHLLSTLYLLTHRYFLPSFLVSYIIYPLWCPLPNRRCRVVVSLALALVFFFSPH